MLLRPRASAYIFMYSAKVSSEPAKCSAKATLASFPETIIIPFKRSSIVTSIYGLRNIVEPPIDEAR